MDFHGHINLQENQMRKLAFDSETDFPVVPVVGRLVFKGYVLYMCVALNGALPIWIPVTNTINTFKHTQAVAADSWVIEHKLTAEFPVVQVYDENNQLAIPDTVTSTGEQEITITFGQAMTGTAIILSSDEIPADGVGVLSPDPVAYVTSFSSQSTMVIKHNLGYYPIVRVFIGGDEVQPSNVIHDSIYQITITFPSAQTGIVRLT